MTWKRGQTSLGGLQNIPVIVICTLLWSAFYGAVRINYPNKSQMWCCRIVTLFHAITSTFLSAWSAFVVGPSPFKDVAGPNNVLQHITCILSLGYFLYDLIWCLIKQTEGLMMLGHHIVSISGFLYIVYHGSCATEILGLLFGSEVTNPLLQLRWFLRSAEVKNIYVLNGVDIAFILLFGVMRVVVGSYFLYTYYMQPNRVLFCTIGGTVFYFIGWYWLFEIIYVFYRKHTRPPPSAFSRTFGAQWKVVDEYPQSSKMLDTGVAEENDAS